MSDWAFIIGTIILGFSVWLSACKMKGEHPQEIFKKFQKQKPAVILSSKSILEELSELPFDEKV